MQKAEQVIRILLILLYAFLIDEAKAREDFTFQGAPISPLELRPFIEGGGKGRTLILPGRKQEENEIIVKDTLKEGELGKKGFLTSQIRYEDAPVQATVGYEYIGALNRGPVPLHVLRGYFCPGGTGEITNLLLIKKQANKMLLVDTLAQGDRCQGGVERAVIKKGKLVYTVNLTPTALLQLEKKPRAKKPKALPLPFDCRVCCIGQAHYQDKQLLSVTLNFPWALAMAENPPKEQVCFKKQYDKVLATRRGSLDIKALRQFQRAYARCLASQGY